MVFLFLYSLSSLSPSFFSLDMETNDDEKRERVLVSTVGSDFRLIVLSSKEPFVISRFLYSN